MRRIILIGLGLALVLTACGDDGAADCPLFGRPGPATGLDDRMCRPERVCEGVDPFVPPEYGVEVIAGLRERVLVNPPDLLPVNPYVDAWLLPETTGVCAVLPDPGGYRLETFADRAAAEAAGGVVTHENACGACSPLQDLAVYLETPDLGGPVRDCALLSLGQGDEATLECITGLGFTDACAQAWALNSANTRADCLEVCLANLDAPHHQPDGSLNDCLACDEAESGPEFKAMAGRTRRSSGIPSGICRPADQVAEVLHDSYP